MNPRTSSRELIGRLAVCVLVLHILAAWIASSHGLTPYQPVFGDPLLEPWRWQTFPELSGLGAQCVIEGSQGTIWFGASDGAWEYDGIKWVYHPTDQMGGSVALCWGTDGSLFLSGQRGIKRLVNGQWIQLFPREDRRFGDIRKLAIGRDGSLWAATSWGALRFQNSKWLLYTEPEIANRLKTNQAGALVNIELLPDSVASKARTNAPPGKRYALSEVCADSQGRVWLATDGGEVLCYDPIASRESSSNAPVRPPGQWTLYNERDGIVCGRFPSILPLLDGTIWVVYGADSGHLNRFDGTAWQAVRLSDFGVPGDCSIPIQTRDGAIWLSGRYVVSRYSNGRWRSYQKPEVPIPTAHNFLFQSSDGALWIGGPGTEIHRNEYQTPRWLTLPDLNFQWESPAGTQWFLHRSGRVVSHRNDQWTSYGSEDGVINAPVALLGTQKGEVWVAGSHEQTAATARFDGQTWTRFVHLELSWGIDWRGALATSDGSVWFGAAVDSTGPAQHRAGILQCRNGEWTHHHQPGRAPRNGDDTNLSTLLPATQRPEPIGKFFCLGESPDHKIWAGRNLLVFYDGRQWSVFAPPKSPVGIIEAMFTTRERELWIGTRQFGALRYDGREWQQFQGKDSLVANSVRSLTQTDDGSIWAATDRGISRFDGHDWTDEVLPEQFSIPHEGGSLKAATAGSLWINRFAPEWNRRAWPKAETVDAQHCEFWTLRYQFLGPPPETTISAGAKTVSQPGNVSVLWSGTVPWQDPKEAQLQFSHRLDGAPWSPFTRELGHAFFTLPSGRHKLEVRARDRDFNMDPSPAILEFMVLPPVWRQAWFIVVMLLLGGAVTTQSWRVFLERSRLRQANRVLAGEIQEREQVETTVRKSEELYRSFIAASPDGIAVISPTGTIQFASRRIHALLGRPPDADLVGTNALEWIAPPDREQAAGDLAAIAQGKVVSRGQYALRRSDGSELFVEISGAALLGADGIPTGIVTMVRDVTARQHAESEIRKLTEDLDKRVQERTADLQQASAELRDSQRALMNLVEDLNDRSLELEAANEKLQDLDRLKSLFIASMSHELRTPLNSIIGFSSILINEWAGPLTSEQKENLASVLRSGKHLLALINDVIDVTKIEAGKIEVVREDFVLRGVVDEVLVVLANELQNKGLALSVQVDHVTLHTDRRRLLQCLLNLVSNAVKFTEKGSVRVSARNSEDGRSVEIAVHDTGIGMSEADLGKLFSPFVRLDSPLRSKVLGTGLGLYLTKKLTQEVLRGEVEVTSTLGQGSRFVLRVPVSI